MNMNHDFDAMIRNLMKTGVTAEDIAKMTSETLNTIRKETEQEKKEKAEKERLDRKAKRYQELEKSFNKAYTSKSVRLEDVGSLAAMVMASEYPNWTEEDIDEFVRGVADSVRLRATMVGKNPLKGIRAVCNKSTTEGRDWWWNTINELEDLLSDI